LFIHESWLATSMYSFGLSIQDKFNLQPTSQLGTRCLSKKKWHKVSGVLEIYSNNLTFLFFFRERFSGL
jgi:hypothetical protein